MLRKLLSHLVVPLLLLFSNSSGNSAARFQEKSPDARTGILEKLIVAGGSVAIDLDLNRLNGTGSAPRESKLDTLRFEVAADSFFTVLVFNDVLRGPELGSMGLVPQNSAKLPEALHASFQQLVVEKIPSSEPFDIVVRDGKTGFVFFNIEGNSYEYDAVAKLLDIKDGRLLISEEFAKKLGRPSAAGSIVGKISISTMMSPIEITTVVNGAAQSSILPPREGSPSAPEVFNPGPDVIVGDLPSLGQFGSSGTRVGLAVGTTSCNAGNVELDWFALPNTDHPVIPQNLYRMSGGATNEERFEQVGQSWLKHAFTALQGNVCSLGCTSAANGTHLGVGCSDPYDASLNASQSGLGSRAWVNPFTGAYPSTARNHTGHNDVSTSTTHRILVEASDLNTTLNSGATYYAEGQYVTPHEYVWCQGHHGECNMFNNVSYRRFNVTGTTSFTFSAVGSTVRTTPAIYAWTGATINTIEPDPGNDGIALVGCKVTNPTAGIWHYEYAVYNENLDRGIQSFSVPLGGCGITVSNLGFHAPPNHPGIANDGTAGDAGYSNTAWTSTQTASALSWSSETLAQNQNANAVRWGTLYNFRFDSNRPPQATNATIGFFKTGAPVTVAIQSPTPDACNPLQLTGAASQKMQGSFGPFSIPLALTGEPGVECRNSGGDHTLVFTFSNNVVSGSASVATQAGGSVTGSPTFAGNTMTVNLNGITDLQQITVTLSGVTDSFTQVLPDTAVSMDVLLGDVDGNKNVTGSDVNLTKAQVGADVSEGNFHNDVNMNGSITGSDVNLVKAQVGKSLSSISSPQKQRN